MSIMFSPDSWQIHEGEYFVSRDFGFSNMCSGLLLKFEFARNSSYATVNPPRFSFGSFFRFSSNLRENMSLSMSVSQLLLHKGEEK